MKNIKVSPKPTPKHNIENQKVNSIRDSTVDSFVLLDQNIPAD